MNDAVLVALITGGLSLIGVVITNVVTSNKSRQTILSEFQKAKADTEKAQAITDTKLQNLTDEVRTHNGFAQKIPKLEARIDNLEHDMEMLHGR